MKWIWLSNTIISFFMFVAWKRGNWFNVFLKLFWLLKGLFDLALTLLAFGLMVVK